MGVLSRITFAGAYSRVCRGLLSLLGTFMWGFSGYRLPEVVASLKAPQPAWQKALYCFLIGLNIAFHDPQRRGRGEGFANRGIGYKSLRQVLQPQTPSTPQTP